LCLRRACRDGDVVEQAEAHGVPLRRVVAGRADERERFAARRLDGRARGEQRRLVRRRGGGRVGIEVRRPLDVADLAYVLRGVAAQNLLFRRRAALAPREGVEQRRQPFRPLRVMTRRVQLREPRVAQDVDCALPSSRCASAFRFQERASVAPPSQSGSASGSSGSGASASIDAMRL
jgi:hypothetical protein